MTFLFLFFLFALGIAGGSFLNVLIFRYNPEKALWQRGTLTGRSQCRSCYKTLTVSELIPLVSFLWQRGKCRSCKQKLSWQYPIVEFLGGCIAVSVPLFFNFFYGMRTFAMASWALPEWYVFLVALWILVFFVWLLIVVIDIRHYVIPNELNIVLVILGILITTITIIHGDTLPLFRDSFLQNYALLFPGFSSLVLNRILGIVLGGGLFAILSISSRGRAMGFGDVKLAAASGFIFGWPDMPLILILSFIFGGIYGVFLMLLKKKGMKDKLPFAPFFILASMVTVFLGSWLLGGYFGLFQG